MNLKNRLDSTLVNMNLYNSRAKAKFAIESGIIYVNNTKITKPGKLVSETDNIQIKGESLKYVSKGGLKLEKAINIFNINLQDKTCMDIGASTGGFTDVMLKNGAKKVYSVDVGHNQLDKSLVNNSKVINLEGTNVKNIKLGDFEKLDFISTDVSFISILKIIEIIYELLKIEGKSVVLIKPQFEAGKENLNKNGVVKDIKIHKKIIENIIKNINNIGFKILGLTYSPIKGPAGNIEYLLYIEKSKDNLLEKHLILNKINEVTEQAFINLK